MANKKLNQAINHAFRAATPDVLDDVLLDCHEQKAPIPVKKKKTDWVPRLTAVAAAFALVFSLFFWNAYYQQNYSVVTTVSLDVNPSIEIKVSPKSKVIAVDALNADGEKILGQLQLTGETLDAAVDALLASMIEHGYLNENANSILVSVNNKDTEKAEKLQKKIADELNNCLVQKNFEGAVISQTIEHNDELKTLADKHEISCGKAKLIERITKQDLRYTFEDLAKLSINELNLLTESGKLDLDDVAATGNASEKKFIGKQAAQEIVLTHAGLAQADVLRMKVELDCENGVIVYEVELHTSEYEYEYDIDAQTGEVLHSEKEEHMQRDEENKPITPDVTLIDEEAAIQAALTHAQLETAEEIECELEKDHGKLYYEIEFTANGIEYAYLVDAVEGKVIRFEKDNDHIKPVPDQEQTPNFVDVDTVKQTVLSHAGVTDVEGYECEIDKDHGKFIYEIEFEIDGVKYDYLVDAMTGQIIQFRKGIEPNERPNHGHLPENPEEPAFPEKPEIPEQPVQPEMPEQPVQPEQPQCPVQPNGQQNGQHGFHDQEVIDIQHKDNK